MSLRPPPPLAQEAAQWHDGLICNYYVPVLIYPSLAVRGGGGRGGPTTTYREGGGGGIKPLDLGNARRHSLTGGSVCQSVGRLIGTSLYYLLRGYHYYFVYLGIP